MIQEKVVNEISLNFPELFIVEKYAKIGFKNQGWSCYFLNSSGQKIRNITKMEHTRLFFFTFFVSFFYDVDDDDDDDDDDDHTKTDFCNK